MEYTIEYSVGKPDQPTGLVMTAMIWFHQPLMGKALNTSYAIDCDTKRLTLNCEVGPTTLVQFKKEIENFAKAKAKAIGLATEFVKENAVVTSENQG